MMSHKSINQSQAWAYILHIERLYIRRYTPDLISIRSAFRPTGVQLVHYFMHQVTRLLETNAYVRCLLLDLLKAFNVIVVLVNEVSELKLPKRFL